VEYEAEREDIVHGTISFNNHKPGVPDFYWEYFEPS
jgi:hypothetical protein